MTYLQVAQMMKQAAGVTSARYQGYLAAQKASPAARAKAGTAIRSDYALQNQAIPKPQRPAARPVQPSTPQTQGRPRTGYVKYKDPNTGRIVEERPVLGGNNFTKAELNSMQGKGALPGNKTVARSKPAAAPIQQPVQKHQTTINTSFKTGPASRMPR